MNTGIYVASGGDSPITEGLARILEAPVSEALKDKALELVRLSLRTSTVSIENCTIGVPNV